MSSKSRYGIWPPTIENIKDMATRAPSLEEEIDMISEHIRLPDWRTNFLSNCTTSIYHSMYVFCRESNLGPDRTIALLKTTKSMICEIEGNQHINN